MAIFLAIALLAVNPAVWGDGYFYYAYLRSLVIDGDLDFANEVENFQPESPTFGMGRVTRTGYIANVHLIGNALIWSFYYVPTHIVSLILVGLGMDIATDGYGPQYLWAVALSTAINVSAGLLLLYNLLRIYFNKYASFIAITIIMFGTSLFAYSHFHPTMSHGNSFFVGVIFLFLWRVTMGRRSIIQTIALGALCGLGILVRAQNFIWVFIPLAETVYLFAKPNTLAYANTVQTTVIKTVLFLAAAAIVFAPQLIVWKILNGDFLDTGYGGRAFDWSAPHFVDVLVSPYHGIILWTPAVIIALVGLALFWKTDRFLAIVALLSFGLYSYIIGSFETWWQGASFGGRMFIGTYPLLSFGFASAVQFFNRRVKTWIINSAVVLLVLWNFNIFFQYAMNIIPRRYPVGLAEMVRNTPCVLREVSSFVVRYVLRDSSLNNYFGK